MIVNQVGYKSIQEVIDLITEDYKFSIYKTVKGTEILILDVDTMSIQLYYPKKDRLPYKVVEGKKITRGERIYSSTGTEKLYVPDWYQIMAYEEFNGYE